MIVISVLVSLEANISLLGKFEERTGFNRKGKKFDFGLVVALKYFVVCLGKISRQMEVCL